MGFQRYVLPSGAVRCRARVKSHGRYVATRVFERKTDAVADRARWQAALNEARRRAAGGERDPDTSEAAA